MVAALLADRLVVRRHAQDAADETRVDRRAVELRGRLTPHVLAPFDVHAGLRGNLLDDVHHCPGGGERRFDQHVDAVLGGGHRHQVVALGRRHDVHDVKFFAGEELGDVGVGLDVGSFRGCLGVLFVDVANRHELVPIREARDRRKVGLAAAPDTE